MSSIIVSYRHEFTEDHLVVAMGALRRESERCRKQVIDCLDHEDNNVPFWPVLGGKSWLDQAVWWAGHAQEADQAYEAVAACELVQVQTVVRAYMLRLDGTPLRSF